jgi:hypothetical protein
VIDFVIDVAPQSIPLYVNGRRWHSQGFAIGDIFNQQQAERLFKHKAIVIWDDQLPNELQALSAVRKALGL